MDAKKPSAFSDRQIILGLSPTTMLTLLEGENVEEREKEKVIGENACFFKEAVLGLIYLRESNFEDPNWGKKVKKAKILQRAVPDLKTIEDNEVIDKLSRYSAGIEGLKSDCLRSEDLKGELKMIYELMAAYENKDVKSPF